MRIAVTPPLLGGLAVIVAVDVGAALTLLKSTGTGSVADWPWAHVLAPWCYVLGYVVVRLLANIVILAWRRTSREVATSFDVIRERAANMTDEQRQQAEADIERAERDLARRPVHFADPDNPTDDEIDAMLAETDAVYQALSPEQKRGLHRVVNMTSAEIASGPAPAIPAELTELVWAWRAWRWRRNQAKHDK